MDGHGLTSVSEHLPQGIGQQGGKTLSFDGQLAAVGGREAVGGDEPADVEAAKVPGRLPTSRAWVARMENSGLAPASISASMAATRVPPVLIMSSMITGLRPFTSPATAGARTRRPAPGQAWMPDEGSSGR